MVPLIQEKVSFLRHHISHGCKVILLVRGLQNISAIYMRLKFDTQHKRAGQLAVQGIRFGGWWRETVLHKGAAITAQAGGELRIAKVKWRVQ